MQHLFSSVPSAIYLLCCRVVLLTKVNSRLKWRRQVCTLELLFFNLFIIDLTQLNIFFYIFTHVDDPIIFSFSRDLKNLVDEIKSKLDTVYEKFRLV